MVIKELNDLMRILNDIKYDLDGSVYTLTDDEYSKVFYVRDQLYVLLQEIKFIKALN
jgi:hypothetical protein